MVDQSRAQWADRARFFAYASRVMRAILVDDARRRGAAKRGAGALRFSLEDRDLPVEEQSEFVLALGHPFGLEQSVSFGIVSRKGAPLTVAAPGFDYIQTDAAINPGNSGGPLVNMAGQVVGVNSMAARNGSIGFAIPSNLVKLLVPQLASKGKVEWGWLGVSIAEVTDEDLTRLNLREARGVLIRGVMPGEPADKGGVKPDDVLVAVDGTPLDTPRDLQRVVSSTPVGKRVRVRLLRAGRETEVEVTIGLYREREPLTEAPGR